MKKHDYLDIHFCLLRGSAFFLLLLLGFSPVIHAVPETGKQVQSRLPSAAKVHYKRSLESYQIPELELLDLHGNKVVLSSLINSERPVLLNFIFTTCPSFCPILSATFGQVQNKFKLDGPNARPLLVSISIDPEHDTPERLKKYASKFKAGPDWTFLTGNHGAILEVQRVFDAYQGEKMNHQPLTFLHKPGSSKWLRLEGFTGAKDLLIEYQQLVSDNAK